MMKAILLIAATFSLMVSVSGGGLKAIYAVNCGGDAHVDAHGIPYAKDPSKDGVASDHGKRLTINRVYEHDMILYQTERYSHSSFGYDIPIKDDGSYVLVLKFSEVYFQRPGGKVFNVHLNKHLRILDSLDIYAQAGFATAHDLIIPFRVSNSGRTLTVGGQSSKIERSIIRIDFVPGSADNPKINAFYVAKGNVEDVPVLPEEEEESIGGDEEDMLYGDDDEEIQFSKSDLGRESGQMNVFYKHKNNVRSGPPAEDPWENENILVAYAPVGVAVLASFVGIWVLRKL